MKKIILLPFVAIALSACMSASDAPVWMGGRSKADHHRKACLDAAYIDKTKADAARSGEQRQAEYEACMGSE
jgi:hypothetical protein